MRGLRFLIVLCTMSVAMFAAANPFLGTWKLNTAKSKWTAGHPTKEMTVTLEQAGSDIKRTATGVDGEGAPINQNATIAWDGKDHPIDAPSTTVAVKQTDSNTLHVTVKLDGKVESEFKVIASKDGKSFTETGKGNDPKGQPFNSVEVFDKQ